MNNLCIITGDEIYDRNEALEKIKASFGELVKGINFIVLDKDTISNLENEINTYPFGYSKKLIIIKIEKKANSKDDDEVDNSKSEILTDELEDILSNIPENVQVVFIGDFSQKSKLYKFIEKNGKCFVFAKKKESEVFFWCKKIFENEKVKIKDEDLSYVIELCGNDKLILKNEIDKIICYALNIKEITKEDIDRLCIKTSDVIIFDLTDSLGNKNTKKALVSLNELLENKEPIQKIAIMIAKHFKSLLVAKIATAQGKNVLEELNTKSAYAGNKYKAQSKIFSEEELIKWIKNLAKLDIDSKLGKIDLKIGLEKLICEMS